MKIIIAFIGLLFSSTFIFTETFAQSLNLPNDFGTIVYKIGGLYFAKDSQNQIIISNETPDIVIKTALDRGREIYIAGGEYDLSKDFSGFDLKSRTHLKLAQDSEIVVPSGYTGYVFRFNSGTALTVMEGGHISEADPIERGWIGIMMQGGTHGVYQNYINNLFISHPYVVIDFNATTGQWISSNTFVNIKANDFVRGIEFEFKGKLASSSGFSANTFRDLFFESGPMTTYGVKDIKHDGNAFYNVQMWDLPRRSISATIDTSAENTIIVGGLMTHQNFVDSGRNTIIIDSWHSNPLLNSTMISAIIKTLLPSEVNNPLPSSYNDSNATPQPTIGFVKWDQAQLVISQQQPSVIKVYGQVSDPKGGKVLLQITKPDGFVERDQAYVTSDGSFYSPVFFTRNSLTGQYRIDVLYQNSNLGSLVLNVKSGQLLLPNQTYAHTNIGVAPSSESNATLSTWIKIGAKLWSQGKLSNDIFGDSIQYLIKVGAIEKPNPSQTPLHQSMYIPRWFKNNAGWWADGQISNSDFISAVQYLLDSRIIQMSS